MRKMLTFALLGGTVGAGFAIAKTTSAEPMADDEGTAMKTVGGGALAGAALGLLFDRRSKRRAKQVAKGAKMAAAVAGVAKAAKPKIEHAIEAGRPRFEQAADATREVAMNAAEAARNRLAKAA